MARSDFVVRMKVSDIDTYVFAAVRFAENTTSMQVVFIVPLRGEGRPHALSSEALCA